jgi:hypothetical protein
MPEPNWVGSTKKLAIARVNNIRGKTERSVKYAKAAPIRDAS